MFGVSFGELIIIGIVVLIVFGPKRLPEIARQMGKFSGELKKTSDAFRKEFYNSVYIPTDETKGIERELKAMLTEEPKPKVEETVEKIEKKDD